MSAAPKVSVLIPTYNCAQYLGMALESVFKQTFQDFEVIVIDDGSTDNTKELVEAYRLRFPDKIQYIYQENQGLACARNTGLRQARGEYIALLDADDIWFPTRLQEQLVIIDADKEIGLIHANITWMDEDGKAGSIPARNLKDLSGKIFQEIFLRKADISCPTVLFRKSCCDEVGLFDVNLTRLGCEDRELWLRIAQKYKIVYLDKSLAYYRVRKGSMSRNYEKMLKARYYVVNKFIPLDGTDPRLRNLAIAKIHRDLGDIRLLEQDFNSAGKEYAFSLRHNPWSFWTLVNWVKSILKIQL